ncbi:MAG: glycosyltransferase family 2 protein [Bacteroidaceae bacterium]|nr:glycosyltransferase family 2 protein [Bacteroidaceae bacterium]
MKLSVVIVSYNVKYHLEQCIRSVQKASEGIESDIWVVDNASSDGSVEYLQSNFPDVHFICNEENVGFSRANNQAICQSKGEYVLLLNPDTIVAEDTLKGCVDFLDSHSKVGATGVRMLNADGTFAPESRRGLPTPFTSFCKMTGLSSLFPKNRTLGRYYMRYLNADEANPIDIISGAFNMIRRRTLDDVGLLDEDFFMYGEDIDLSYRMLLGGWQNYYLPYNILHYKGESSEKSSYRYVHVFYNAMLIFFNKHFGKKYILLGYLIRLAVIIRAIMDMLIRFLDRILPEGKPEEIPYMRFDLQKTSVTDMLSALRNQKPDNRGKRFQLETISFDGTLLIRHNEVIPLKQG